MTELGILRCRGCGTPNGAFRSECVSCGTLLAGAPEVTAAGLPASAAQAPSSLRGVAWVFGVALTVGVAGLIAGQLEVDAIRLDVTLTSLLGVVAVGSAIAGRAAVAPLLATAGGWRGLAVAAGGFCLLVAFGTIYFGSLRWLNWPMLRMTDIYVAAGWPRWSMYLFVAVAPPLTEEIIFRGYAMDRLDTLLTPRESLVVQAALFAVLHLGPIIYPSHFVIGLVLGVVRRRTGSLYPSMAVHGAWNGMIVWSELANRPWP